MTRKETASMLMILQAAYPQFYKDMGESEGRAMMNLWSDMFADENLEVVKLALYRLIQSHAGFPPSIADVKEKIREIKSVVMDEPTNEDLWNILRAGVEDGLHGAKEHFDAFPPVLKRYCQSPRWLQDHAEHDPQTLDTVDKALFMKQIDSMKQRVNFESEIPERIRGILRGNLSGKELMGGGVENAGQISSPDTRNGGGMR